MKVTLLGCGTSVGVPAIGRAGWGACDPDDPRNRRQRCAVLVQTDTTNVLVDAGPDIRNQLLPLGLKKIDTLLVTHTHSDRKGLQGPRQLACGPRGQPQRPPPPAGEAGRPDLPTVAAGAARARPPRPTKHDLGRGTALRRRSMRRAGRSPHPRLALSLRTCYLLCPYTAI